MHALLKSGAMEETRGQMARRRREALGVSRDRLAQEAGLVSKTIKSYEEDARANMPSGPRIEEALDRLERQRTGGTATARHRRASDTPTHQVIDSVIASGEVGEVQVRIFKDGTRAIFLVPPGASAPTDEQIQQTLRDVRSKDE